MVKNYENNCHQLNKLLNNIFLKRKHFEKLKVKIKFLRCILKQSYKKINIKMIDKKTTPFLIAYIIELRFSKTNTFLQITNSFGVLKFFCSAGNLCFNGKSKTARTAILKKMINLLIKKLKFLKKRPVTLHLKNIGFKKS